MNPRLERGLLQLIARLVLPSGFRERHIEDLLTVNAELIAEARRRGRLPALWVWVREAVSLVGLGWRVRLEANRVRPRRRWLAGVSLLDVKLGARMLVKQPLLTLVAVFALSVAIPVGLVPEHFTSALEAPLPVEEGDRIVALRHRDIEASVERPLPLADFETWRTSMRTFGELAVTTIRNDFNVISEGGRAEPVPGAVITASAFSILKARPALGRPLLREDELPGGANVVVIGHDLWQSSLGGDPAVLGSFIRVAGVPHEVVGVMPARFEFPFRDRLWLPMREDVIREGGDALGSYQVFGRLAPGATLEEARAEVRTLTARRLSAAPAGDGDPRAMPEVVTFAEGFFQLPAGGFKSVPAYIGVQLLALFLLAVACANVGMLVFAKTASRTSELAVRTALGASRSRIVLQLGTEALVFALVAAGTGLLVADRVSIGFGWLTEWLPYWVDLRVNGETVIWAFALAVLSAGLVSVIPAFKVTGTSVQGTLQRAAAGRSGIRFGGISSALIVTDVMLAVAIAGLAVGLSDSLTPPARSAGIEAEEFLYAAIRVPRVEVGGRALLQADFERRVAAVQEELLLRLGAEAGVRGVAVANTLPGMDHSSARLEVQGWPDERASDGVRALRAGVGLGYFDALGHQVLHGRDFGEADLAEGATSIIVNTDFVDRVLDGRNPLGQRVRTTPRNGNEAGPWHEIVGVVPSLGMNEAMPGGDAGIYHPERPGVIHPVRLAIHVGRDPETFSTRLRTIAREVDASVIVAEAVPLPNVFSFNRFTMDWIRIGARTLIWILVALSASGIFALMSFTVVQRTREIGIRAALGAKPRDVAATVARRSVMQLVLGVALGVPLAWRLLMELQRDMERVPGQSPFWLAVTTGVVILLGIGVIACGLPTRRALRIMPTEAFRSPD